MTGIAMAQDISGAGLLDEYLDDEELAEELNISTRTLHRWRRLGDAPPVTRIGGRNRTRRGTACEWLRSLEEGRA